jgi:hypothetical protein
MPAMTTRTRPGRWGRGALGLAGLGATLGTALDGIHLHLGAIDYTRPVLLGYAWWVPLLFAGAFSIGLIGPALDRVVGRIHPLPDRRAVALSLALFVASYFTSVIALPWPVIALLLTGMGAASWWCCDRSRVGLGIALGGGLGGLLVEGVLVHAGVFRHLHPVVLGVSGWLPFLYLSAAIALITIARRLVDA